MCGVYLNRSRIIITLLQVPLLIFLFNSRPLFDVLGFSDEAAFYSEQYIYIVAPGLYLNGLNDANRRMLNCMGYQNGPMLVQMGCTILHIFWCYLFVDVFNLEVQGTGFATVVTYFINLIALHVYVPFFTSDRLRKEAWFLPNRACFDLKGLMEFMKLGIPSIGMQCLEWWGFELMTLFSAWISMEATAAQIITLNTAVIAFMPILGIHYASSVVIG
jgi:MATE family multidrug resistance protein